MRQDNALSYGDLERAGWPAWLIEDYLGRLRELTPQKGSEANPNGVYVANLNGFYIDTVTPALWFNPTPGESSGWIAL